MPTRTNVHMAATNSAMQKGSCAQPGRTFSVNAISPDAASMGRMPETLSAATATSAQSATVWGCPAQSCVTIGEVR